MATNKTITVELSSIKADPNNPRQEFDPTQMKFLEESIKQNGILTPLSVELDKDGKYLLVDGERRFRASTALKLKEVPVTILPAMSDTERLIKRFHLQEQHSSWSAWEKGNAIKGLQLTLGIPEKEVGAMLGMASSTVNKYNLVANLSRRTATQFGERKLPFEWVLEVARTVTAVQDEALRQDVEEALFNKIDNKLITRAREVRKYRQAIQHGGNPILKKVIENDKYTPTQASNDAGLEDWDTVNGIRNGLGWVILYGEKLLAKKNPTVPNSLHGKALKAVKIVRELADLDYENNEE